MAPPIRLKSMKYVKEENCVVCSSKSLASYSAKVLERGMVLGG